MINSNYSHSFLPLKMNVVVPPEIKKKSLRIDVHSLNNVRLICNDFLHIYFDFFGYKQNMFYDNIKIIIGLISGLFGLIICVISMKLDWDISYIFVLTMVLIYYVINGLYYIIEYFIEGSQLTFINKISNDKDIVITSDVNCDGIWEIKFKDKTHKLIVYDLFYSNGNMNTEEMYRSIHKIFKFK